MAYLYPKKVIPQYKQGDKQPGKNNPHGACGPVGYYSMYMGMINPNNLCNDSKSIASWGKIQPDKLPYSTALWWGRDCITTWSGSYNLPTPFDIKEWDIPKDIPTNSIVTKITIEYAIQPAQYSQHGPPAFLYNEATYAEKRYNADWVCGGSGNTVVNKIKNAANNPYKIHYKLNGKSKSFTGKGLEQSLLVAAKNSQYNLKVQKQEIYNNSNSKLTVNDIKKMPLTFQPPRNLAGDVGRIVMQFIRLNITYKKVKPKFIISKATATPSTLINCDNAQTKIYLKLKNNGDVKGTTQVKISGSGITNAKMGKYSVTGSDTFKKDKSNNYIWTVKNDCNSRELYFNVSYKQINNYKITATVTTNGSGSKTIPIYVKPCQPSFNFEFLDSEQNENNIFKYSSNDAYLGDNEPNPSNIAYFKITLNKPQTTSHNETLQINSDGLKFIDDWIITTDTGSNDITISQTGNIYNFKNVNKYKDVCIMRKVLFNESGNYNVVGKYINTSQSEWNDEKNYIIEVIGASLGRDYFKLRLEDGSDIKYNSLMITEGDDLLEPLTYTAEEIDKYVTNMEIYGENKRIPVNETQYIHFTVKLNPIKETIIENGIITEVEKDIELKNVLTYIDIYTAEKDASNIIVGAGQGTRLLETEDEYICSIDKISTQEPTIVKLAVKSDIEIDDVVVKIKPYNYDGYNDEIGWIPTHIMFKDIPNIKISIEGISDLVYDENISDNPDSYFWLYYKIQNLSHTEGKNVRFQLKEPNQFKKICYQFEEDKNCDNQSSDTISGAWFNKNNRIITFPTLEANSAERILAVKYKAQKRGIYNFIIHTLDDENTLIDDQYENSYKHTVMVNIPNDVRISTDVSKGLPYVNELIDFHIQVKNLYKKQKNFKFEIYDIGSYDTTHNTNDYLLEYVKNKKGTFTPVPDNNYKYPDSHTQNKIGEWVLDDIDINDIYHLTLSLRPQDIGNHIFKTVFIDQFGNKKDFYNEVKVLENNKQLEFNAYHAINEDGTDCTDCNKLVPICDDDFINLNDEVYYVFEIKNNNRSAIQNALHIYARLPPSFLTNDILCSSHDYIINQDNNLITFTIPNLPGCKNENSTVKICMKIKPSEIGQFVSNFSLSTRNSKVLYKQLHLTVDTEFNNRKIEHEIKIYNFTKTNKYYRYEIDNVGEIFKFFNTGDKTLRPIEIEEYSEGSIETYKGTNLKRILKDIKKHSKYVDPLFFREGNNKLADKGYELFPDGLIRRFGLLNSEVYHYSGQFPIVKDLVDKAMKWDVDKWDTKVWASDDYDNGVFSLTIDYEKIPTNFNVLDGKSGLKNLQQLVNNTKPYGTKAICHYSATIDANLQINIDNVLNKINHDIEVSIGDIDDFTLTSLYNRFDSTLQISHEDTKTKLKTEIDSIIGHITKKKEEESVSSTVQSVSTHIFADKISKQTTSECYNLIANTYNASEQEKNIDITKPFSTDYDTERSLSLSNMQILNYGKDIDDKSSIGFIIKPYKNTQIYTHDSVDDSQNIKNNIIYCIYCKDNINGFNGFKLILNDNIIQERNIQKDISQISIQIQMCPEGNNNILHFWGSVNQEEYYHIGLLMLSDFNNPQISVYNNQNYPIQEYSIDKEKDKPITFKISDKIKTLHKDFDSINAIQNNNKWDYLKNINKNNNKYASFENKINIDKECDSRKINVPKIVLKYNNIDIDNLDEIVDINFKIEAQSNKNNFEDDININLFKDGDKYIPENNIAHEIKYPNVVSNINQKFLTTFEIEQNNITICSDCLQTSLGYYNNCPHCESPYVHHTIEKTPATACYNCGWIINDWNDYCTHCLSHDVEKIQIDYNKTYCNNCGKMSNNYYERCPYCTSSDVTHLTNNTNRYQILGDNRQNIEPIVAQTNQQIIDIFSLYAPFNKSTTELKQLEYLKLIIDGTNNNDGKYYYCESCNKGGLGNYKKCPKCGSSLIHNHSISNIVLKPFYNSNQAYETISSTYNSNISTQKFRKDIDLIKCAYYNSVNRDKFKLSFTLENQSYNEITDTILKLPINDEDKATIIDGLLAIDISIDNLSIDYKYINEYEWGNLGSLEGLNHTGVVYEVPNNETTTDSIYFGDFDIKGEYEHAYLYINGFLKDIPDNTIMHVKIYNNNQLLTKDINITDVLFNTYFDIIKESNNYINDLSVEISFDKVNSNSKIIITDCNISLEYKKYHQDIHDNINQIASNCIIENNDYLFKPIDNNLWGLNQSQPYYLSGRQLDSNLICYIDFGKLDLQEYIRVYSIDMIISYKAKTGNIITESISTETTDKTFKILLKAAGYSDDEINTIIDNDITLSDALLSKNIEISKEDSEKLLSGIINSQNGALWGSINYPKEESLYKIESEVTNINNDDELINDIPLYYRIAQSFNTQESFNSISIVYIDYFGKRGYPNDTISVYLCHDDNGQPGNIIASNKIKTNDISEVLNVDLDTYNLRQNTQYWIVLEDINADKNNYHRFNYNNSLEIGQLITYSKDHNITYEQCVLSFGIDSIEKNKIFYQLPTTWIIDSNTTDSYKIHNTLYRYNIQDGNNVSLSNFHIKSGYSLVDSVPSTNTIDNTEDTVIEEPDDIYIDDNDLEDIDYDDTEYTDDEENIDDDTEYIDNEEDEGND